MARKFTYSSTVTGAVREAIKRDVIQSAVSDPKLRAEIQRIFQVANRRIQNVESSGVFSPAVASLGDRGNRYTKFSLKGRTWNELKMEYGRAVAFLQQPTSTARGSKEYNTQLMKRYNLTEQEFSALTSEYSHKMHSLSGTDFVDKYLKRYKDFSGEYEQAVASSSNQMESEAHMFSEAFENQLIEDMTYIVDDFKGLDIPF